MKTYYKLYDNEEGEYYCIIVTNVKCTDLIESLISLYQDKDTMPDYDDEDFEDAIDWHITNISNALKELNDEDDIDYMSDDEIKSKATELFNNFIDDIDILGNTEEFVVDSLTNLGINVGFIDCIDIPY